MSIDLTTRFGSLELRSPIIVGACPLTCDEQTRIAMNSAGVGAIVLPSLFEEQVLEAEDSRGVETAGLECDAAAIVGTQVVPVFGSTHAYLELISRASKESPIPVIASLSGRTAGPWLNFVRQLEDAGAAAIELNPYPPHPTECESLQEMEALLFDFVTKIDATISIPLFLKAHREFAGVGHLARRLLSGVEGITLFGRLPQIDIRLDEPDSTLEWGLTSPGSVTDSIRTIMRVHTFCPAMSLAANGGIGDSCDLIKALLAGADVGMVVSALYRDGPDVIRSMLDGLVQYMESHHLKSLDELREIRPLRFDNERDRADYIRAVASTPATNEIVQPGVRKLRSDRWGHLSE